MKQKLKFEYYLVKSFYCFSIYLDKDRIYVYEMCFKIVLTFLHFYYY